MADVERELLAKVIRDRAYTELIEAKVSDRYFVDEEHLLILKWMQEHYREYGESPSEQALKADHPTYKLPATPEPLAYYIDRARARFKYDVLQAAVADSADVLAEDMQGAGEVEQILASALTEVTTHAGSLRDHDLTNPEDFAGLIEYYEELAEEPDSLRGWSTGFPTLDIATMGLQKGQLITLVGPPKAGKSTVALCVADHIVEDEDGTVLMISFEMSYEEMVARWVGLRCGLNYRRLLKGQMNDMDRKRLNRQLAKLEKAGEDRARLILSDDISSTTTVSGVIAKIQQHRPDVVIIDGVYLMDDENGEPKGSSQAITNITRSLKRAGLTMDIPILITTQVLLSKMRGQTIKASSIGYSSSFGQDSDTVVAVEPREDENERREHWLKVLLSRSGPNVEVQIDFDWSTSTFTEFASTYDPDDDPDLEDDGKTREQRRAESA